MQSNEGNIRSDTLNSLIFLMQTQPFSPSPSPKASQRKQNLQKASKHTEVIAILTDEQEKQQLERNMFELHFKYEISKAQLSGSTFEKLFAIMKHLQTGSTLIEKQEKAKQHIRSYFRSKINLNLQTDYFVPRVDAGLVQNPGLIYQKRYLVYGIDLLAIRQILENYNFKNPTKKFLDSSHLLLQFPTNQDGFRFLQYRVINFNKSLLHPFEGNAHVLARNWVQLGSYSELIFDRRQFIRNFTEADEKHFAERPPVPDLYRVYQEAKRQLMQAIQDSPQIQQLYEQINAQEQSQKQQFKGYRSFLRDKKRFIRRNDRFSKMNSNSNAQGHSQGNARPCHNYHPDSHAQQFYNNRNQADAFRKNPQKCGLDRIVYTGHSGNFTEQLSQENNKYDYQIKKGPFWKQNNEFRSQNMQAKRPQTNPQQPASQTSASHNTLSQGTHNPPNAFNIKSDPSNLPKVPQAARNPLMQDLQSQKSNSHYSSLQLQLQDFQLFSGQMSSINQNSKHQISHIHQPQFSFQQDSSCPLHSDFTPSNHFSSQQNASSLLEVEHQNPDFKQHFSEGIEQIFNGGIKQEPEDDREIEDLLMNVSRSKKEQQVESEDSSDWNLNLQQEPAQQGTEKDQRSSWEARLKQGVVNLED